MPYLDSDGIVWKLLSAAVAALSAVVTWAWVHTHGRIEKVDKKSDDKADRAEVDRHRDHISKLFDKISDMDRRTEQRFMEVERISHDRHVELLGAIHEVGQATRKR